MESRITDQIRLACQAVAQRSRYVRIDLGRLAEYARTLPIDRLAQPQLDRSRYYLGHGDDTVAFFLTLNAVNFGSGYFPHLRKRPGMSGFYTIASSINDYYRDHGPLSAERLVGITVDDCLAIFDQDPADAPARELMGLFALAWNDLGRYLRDQFQGRFTELAAAAERSAIRLIGILAEMPFFRDVERYDELEVPFYKRAQITSADLALAFDGRGPGQFYDLDQLTMFADNLVPHVLRLDGVLVYDQRLAERIDREELIPAGSVEEVEIRASAVHTVELIVAQLRAEGHEMTASQIDYLLWNRGQEPYYKRTKPRHRTRTVFY